MDGFILSAVHYRITRINGTERVNETIGSRISRAKILN